MTPAQPVSSSARFASSADFTSPLTMTGIDTTSRAFAAQLQSAAPEWPIVRRAAVDRERGDARVLEATREIDDRHVRLGAEADARLHGDRERHARDDHLRHRDHRLGIAEPAGARAATGDLRHPAAAVDVEERAARAASANARGLGEALGIGAVDLDRRRACRRRRGVILRCALRQPRSRPSTLTNSVTHDLGADARGRAGGRPRRSRPPWARG